MYMKFTWFSVFKRAGEILFECVLVEWQPEVSDKQSATLKQHQGNVWKVHQVDFHNERSSTGDLLE